MYSETLIEAISAELKTTVFGNPRASQIKLKISLGENYRNPAQPPHDRPAVAFRTYRLPIARHNSPQTAQTGPPSPPPQQLTPLAARRCAPCTRRLPSTSASSRQAPPRASSSSRRLCLGARRPASGATDHVSSLLAREVSSTRFEIAAAGGCSCRRLHRPNRRVRPVSFFQVCDGEPHQRCGHARARPRSRGGGRCCKRRRGA